MRLPGVIRICLVACFCAAGFGLAPDAVAAPRKVLIVYSWHDLMPWQAGVRAGLQERLQGVPEAQRPEIYEERVDAGRLGDPAAGEALAVYLARKYAHVPLDTVIGESQRAADLLTRNPELFPAAKRYAVNAAESGSIPPAQVVIVRQDPRRALLAIPSVVPDRERLVAVVDHTILGQHTRDELTAAASALPPGTQLEVIENYSFDELYARLRDLPPHSALLYFPVFEDRLGVRAMPRQVLERIVASANAPVFAHHDTFLGSGIVGGYLLSSRRVGALIGGIALGEPLPQDAAALDAAIKAYQFDHRQLVRWNISADRLPLPHDLIGRTPSIWTTYRWQLGGVAAAIALQALLILALVRALAQRKKTTAMLGRERDLLAQRTIELEAANRELQDFSYAISHDLRAPLRAVAGYAQIVAAEHGAKLDDEGRQMLARVRSGAERMGLLIDSLVEFMLIARRKLDLREVDMAALVREVFDEQRAAAPQRRLRLELGAMPPAWGDRALLRRVFENVVANAVKFIPADADGVVSVRGEIVAGGTVYHVADNGVGFDMRFADKLFRAFERLHGPGEFEGLGVGLAVVKRIVGRHGGRVWAEGEVGAGATVHFALPLRSSAA